MNLPKVKTLWIASLLIVVVAVTVPIVIQLNAFNSAYFIRRFVHAGSGQEWLQFWSSYLGTLISIPITVSVALLTLRYEQRNSIIENETKRQNIEFDNIMKATKKYQVEVEEFIHLDFKNYKRMNYYQLKKVNNMASKLFNDNKKDFLLQINLSKAKLPEENRNFFDRDIESVDKLLKESEEINHSINDYFNIIKEILQSRGGRGRQSDEISIPTVISVYNMIISPDDTDIVKDFFGSCDDLKQEIKPIINYLNDISELSLNRIKKTLSKSIY